MLAYIPFISIYRILHQISPWSVLFELTSTIEYDRQKTLRTLPWPQPRPWCLLWDSECVVAGGFRLAKWSAKNSRALGVKMSPFSGKCFFKNGPSLCSLEKTIDSWDSSVKWSTRKFFHLSVFGCSTSPPFFQITICCAASRRLQWLQWRACTTPQQQLGMAQPQAADAAACCRSAPGCKWYPENVDHRGRTHWILKRY